MKTIPSGTVTFLFTDIEGSTGLWEQYPEQMRTAFRRQEAILRETAAKHGGYVYKMIGDAFQVAFETAPAAICAALEGQRRLQMERWGETPIRVRMALHTGVTEERGDDYVGPALNRVGRLLGAGYGGQVLLTQATCDLVRDDLPCDVRLRDLGERRFKDLVRVEHIYQLEAADLQGDFPPLKTLDAFPHNLPSQLTSFIGREREMLTIKLLLVVDRSRLVTLTGAGGTGKTRLALQVGADLLEGFRDGAWLVELAPLMDPALVPQTVLAALGAREVPGKAISSVLSEYLRSRQLLLILDNCEHLVEACARLAEGLLKACPDLKILATSREILGVAGEVALRVPSLSMPAARERPTLEKLAEYEAVRLFVERATQALPGFELTAGNAPVIVRICNRLDGIPLAIELAAARVRLLSVEQIAARLEDAFRLLGGGSRTALPRHQTLKALIDWSYNLLSAPERSLLIRLAVFAGGWTLEAAEEICGEEDRSEIFPLLAQLVDKSLVMAGQGGEAEARYRLLETIRQYARQRSEKSGDGERVRDRHLDFYLMLARQAEPQLRGKDQVAWLDRLDMELDNLRAAMEWACSVRWEEGLELGTALLWFYHIRSHGKEGIDWLERLLAAEAQAEGGQAGNPEQRLKRAKALDTVGFLVWMQNQPAKGREYLKESVAIFQELGEGGRQGLAGALQHLAGVTDDGKQKQAMYEESLDIARKLEDPFSIAQGLQELGWLRLGEGRFEEAKVFFDENLALRRELDDLDGIGFALLGLGNLEGMQGHYERAKELYAESLACYQRNKNVNFMSQAIFGLGNIAWSQGDYGEASRRFEEVRVMSQEIGYPNLLSNAASSLGMLAWSTGEYEFAVKRAQKALQEGQETGEITLMINGYFLLAKVALSQWKPAEAEANLRKIMEITSGILSLEVLNARSANIILDAFGMLARRKGELTRAVSLFAAAEAICGWAIYTKSPAESSEREADLADLRAELGEAVFSAAWAEGQKLEIAQALVLAQTV
jgi:predicted ATPase/class 3 adenylate cyclase